MVIRVTQVFSFRAGKFPRIQYIYHNLPTARFVTSIVLWVFVATSTLLITIEYYCYSVFTCFYYHHYHCIINPRHAPKRSEAAIVDNPIPIATHPAQDHNMDL